MQQSTLITQGIAGLVLEETGNSMPMKGAPPVTPKGLKTTVYVYEPTNISQVSRIGTAPEYTLINTKMVASVESDSTGAFAISLPVGTYSLFVKYKGRYYANMFDSQNNINLITVVADQRTEATITVNSGASY